MKRLFHLAPVICAATLFVGCPSDVDKLLEEARFLLDTCNPTRESTLDDCQGAVDRANEIQVDDPDNAEAALIESNGETGLARFDFLTFVANLAELADSGTDDFSRFRDFISDYETEDLNEAQGLTGLEIDLDAMERAIDAFDEALADVDVDDDGTATNEKQRQASFQLGLTQALDSFIRPVKLSAGVVGNVETGITAAVATLVENDFLGADDNIIQGGGDEDELSDILRPLRENYCRCSLQTPLGGTAGFSENCLEDLMRCELYDGDGIEQDYDGDGDFDVADCVTLLTPGGIDACGGEDTDDD